MSAPPASSSKAHHATNEWALERHVYEPHVVGLPPVGQYLREIWRRREFAFELARSKLREQQFETVFGMLWLVLNPILLAGVYFILIDIVRGGRRPPDFFAHLTASIFAYYLISQSLRDGVMSVVRGSRLILNSAFPRMLLPLSSVVLAIKRFLPTVIIYIPIHLASHLPVGVHDLWAIPLLALMVCMAAGFAMLAASVQVYFRDLKSFLPYVLRIMLYAAPVLYFASRVPDRYQILVDINPLGRLFSAWDNVIHFGHGPGVHNMVIATIWSLGALIVGAGFFMSREREFAVRI
jgi:teichoic acid transport system permease protein